MARGEATPARRSTRAAASVATPRTTRRAAAAAAVASDEDQPQVVAAPRTTRRRAAVKKAAEVPLEQEGLTELEPEAEEQAAETPKPPRSTSRRGAASVDKAAFRAAAATPLTKSRASSPKPRPRIGAVGSPLFLLLLLAASGSVAAYFALPFCQQRDCGELFRNLPDLAADAATETYSVLRERALQAANALHSHAHAAADAFQAHAHTAMRLIRGKKGGAATGCRLDGTAALHAILPAGEEFTALQAAALAGLAGAATADDRPAVALFACEDAAGCDGAVEAVVAAVPEAACVLQLQATAAAGEVEGLHAQVAAFLSADPSGVVAINRVDEMPPALLSLLVEATAEGGSVMGSDGELVSTAGATFVLTAKMISDVFDDLHEEEARFMLAAKNQLVVDLALRAPAGRKEEVVDLAKTLRRRISAVVPVVGDPQEGLGDSAGSEAGECLLDGAALVSRLLPAGPAWELVREVAADALGPERPDAGHAPPALLFACDTDEACDSTARQAARSTAGGRACVLQLEGSQLGSLEEMQEALAAFLTSTPTGIVVVSRLDQLEPELLAVLADALSYDGTVSAGGDADPVPTAGATFLLTMRMPPAVFLHAANDAFFLQDAQLQVLADFTDRAVDKAAAGSLVEALLERIDATLPVGSLAAASVERDVARHTQQAAADADEAAAAAAWNDQAEFEVHGAEPGTGDAAAEEEAEEDDGNYGGWMEQDVAAEEEEAGEEVAGDTAAAEGDREFGSLEEALQYAADVGPPGQEPAPADGDDSEAAEWEVEQEEAEQPAEEEWSGDGEEGHDLPAQDGGVDDAEGEDMVAEAVVAAQ